MLPKPKCPVIGLEEHYWDQELAAHAQEIERNPKIAERLFDLGTLRLKEMDEAGVDVQVLSHGAPSGQQLKGADASAIVARVNDRLAAFVKTKPDRFAAFGALATCDPAVDSKVR
jgi:2,3-dihydroxybenzoate decarboxylase